MGIEAGVSSLADAEALAASGLGGRCLRVLVEVPQRDPPEAVDAAAGIDRALDEGKLTAPRLHHGKGVATWSVLEGALARGRDIRVGLEDTLVHADGRRAEGNAELVRAAARMVARARSS